MPPLGLVRINPAPKPLVFEEPSTCNTYWFSRCSFAGVSALVAVGSSLKIAHSVIKLSLDGRLWSEHKIKLCELESPLGQPTCNVWLIESCS